MGSILDVTRGEHQRQQHGNNLHGEKTTIKTQETKRIQETLGLSILDESHWKIDQKKMSVLFFKNEKKIIGPAKLINLHYAG